MSDADVEKEYFLGVLMMVDVILYAFSCIKHGQDFLLLDCTNIIGETILTKNYTIYVYYKVNPDLLLTIYNIRFFKYFAITYKKL